MLIFKLLHILSMFGMVTTQIGGEFVYTSAIWRRDVRALAASHRILEQSRLGLLTIVTFVSGVVFGVLTAATAASTSLPVGWSRPTCWSPFSSSPAPASR